MANEHDTRMNHSAQYGCPAVVARQGMTADDIIKACRDIGAIFHEDGPDDECFVVEVRSEVGPELWTERALRGSV
jgi:hypothetical protein